MVGKDFMDDIKSNPYDLGGKQSRKSGSNSPVFRKKKGLVQHVIDVQRLNSKKNLKFYLRDGNRFIQKTDHEAEWYVKDNREHCHHDRDLMQM